MTRAFDTADRPIASSSGPGAYVYDLLGRATNIPAADAPEPVNGNLALAYYDNDLPRSIAQGETETTFTLDAADRRAVATTTGSGTSIQTINHYTDSGDSPTWTTDGTTWTRFAELISGDLSMTVTQDGIAELAVVNNHGDVVSTIGLPGSGAASNIGSWQSYDEYGIPATANTAQTGGYGWLGSKQRAADGTGLILMGARLYNPVTGVFS